MRPPPSSTPALNCGVCEAELRFDEKKGWPKRCSSCGTEVLAPQPGPQEQALASPADIIFFGGAVIGGKSYGAGLFARKFIAEQNCTVLALRQERTMLLGAGGLFQKFQAIFGDLDPEVRQSSMYFDLRFAQWNSVIEFAGCRHLADFKKYEGNEYSIMLWDEGQHLLWGLFLKLMQRNRSPDGCIVDPRMFITFNPPEPGDPGYWIRSFIDWFIGPDGLPIPERAGQLRYFTINDNQVEWVDPDWRDEDGEPPTSMTFIPALPRDNPAGLSANRSYLKKIRAQSEVDQERLLRGNFNAKHGAQMFGKGRLVWLDGLPAGVADHPALRYWDLGGGMNDSATRNGLGGIRLIVTLCPKCDGHRFLGDTPCPVCNVTPDGRGGVAPFRPRHKVEEDNEDGPLEALWFEDPVWQQGDVGELEELVIEVARMDPSEVPQYIEEERGTSGKVTTHHYEKLLPNRAVFGDRPTGKKQVRAKPLVSIAEKGLFFVVRSGNDVKVRRAFETFSPDGSGEFKDLIDAMSGAYGAYLEHEWPPKIAWVM